MIAYMNSGMLWGAGLLETALAACEIHLFKSGEGIVIGPSLLLADLVAAKADYTGYLEITVAAMLAPVLNPLGGGSTTTGTQQFATAAPYTVGNSIGGGWIQDAAGVLLMAWDYDPPRVMAGAGDAIPAEVVFLFG